MGGMVRGCTALGILALVFGFGGAGNAAPPSAELARNAGEVGGVVACDDGGATQFVVYIPGRSFSARTGPAGEFTLNYVPAGTWDLVVETGGETVGTVPDVVVIRRQANDLGELDICPDADGDGFDITLDCDDTDPTINPDATELCDGFDNDCDGLVDEGNPGGGASCSTGLAGVCAEGTTSCESGSFVCAPLNPPTSEVCDGLDNDCDGTVDEGGVCTGVCGDGVVDTGEECDDGNSVDDDACSNECLIRTTDLDGDGFTVAEGDCDDADPLVNPGATEICDGLDNDCDGTIDNDVFGVGESCDGPDSDSCLEGTLVCGGVSGLVCSDDTSDNVEICDGFDNDCDGLVDEGGVCDPG